MKDMYASGEPVFLQSGAPETLGTVSQYTFEAVAGRRRHEWLARIDEGRWPIPVASGILCSRRIFRVAAASASSATSCDKLTNLSPPNFLVGLPDISPAPEMSAGVAATYAANQGASRSRSSNRLSSLRGARRQPARK